MTDIYKQVAEKLTSANSTAIILPMTPTPDAVAAGLALHAYLKRLEKDSVVISADGDLPKSVDFLPGYGEIMRDFTLSKSFVIDVSTKRTPLSELSYKKEDDKLSIFLKAKSGEFSAEDVTFKSSKFPYEAVVLIGTAKYEALGSFYSKFAELFFETPVVNIDYRGANENYGQFNLVNLNAASQAEIVFDLINEMEKDLINPEIATSLLTGIISETNSFQHMRTTPQVFLKASQLVSLGGNQQDIINRMFKNKSMGFLKLWGRVLARLKHEPEYSLAHSSINKLDVDKTGANSQDTEAVIKEMAKELGFAKVHVFFHEIDAQKTDVYISAPASINLMSLFTSYQPASLIPQVIKITLSSPLTDAETTILGVIRKEAAKLS